MREQYALIVSFVLAAVFACTFLFLTVEIPYRLNFLLRSYFPDLAFQFELIEKFLAQVRPIGYLCFIAVIALTVVGFAFGNKASSLGSFMFFLPAFGYFACSMFFLVGLGILRIVWAPLWDVSPDLLKLGDVVYVPAILLVYLFNLCGLDVRVPLSFLFIASGLLTFFMAVFTRIFGKIKGKEIIDFWIYKFSRHPQYLGFLLWSYGVMLLATFTPYPRGGYFPEPSFPWLVSALIVFCVAWSEEIQMKEKHGENYLKYQENTPFMMWIPGTLSRVIALPFKALSKKDSPKRIMDITYAFMIYFIILTGLSFLILKLNIPLR